MKTHKSVLKRNIMALYLNMSVSAKFFLQFESEESNAEITLWFAGRYNSGLSIERVERSSDRVAVDSRLINWEAVEFLHRNL